MDLTELIVKLGGIATTKELLHVLDRGSLRDAVDDGRIIRVARGHYSLPGGSEALAAARRVSGVVSHLSAAQHWGWKIKLPPDRPVVTVPRNRKLTGRQRAGTDVRWFDLHPDDVRDGVTSKLRTVGDCARSYDFDEALSVADSAVRHGDVTKTQIRLEALAGPRTGRPAALRVADAVDGRAANPFESVLRAICLEIPGLLVEPQVWVGDVGRVDLLDITNNLILEADSWEFHGARSAFVRDVRRYTCFVRLGFAVVRFTWEEVMFEQEYVRAVLADMVRLGPPWRAPDAA
ncbi:MAG TPA: type IV toxin-antitoxin system AbiEi family antitoxin domain-containing protein [Nocardioides sp.]|nr:type IV toxin-antitoxin system AbiEi family antitoxin domain-containing protein [Nocardioides sp.]